MAWHLLYLFLNYRYIKKHIQTTTLLMCYENLIEKSHTFFLYNYKCTKFIKLNIIITELSSEHYKVSIMLVLYYTVPRS